MTLERSCANHEGREAVCRCPRCRRSFCRECVTEHEGRLLCAACLVDAPRGAAVRRGRLRALAPAFLGVGGLLLAWTIYFAAAEGVIIVTERSERATWQDR